MAVAGGLTSRERLTSIEIDRGLYAVRYAGPLSPDAPAAFIRPASDSQHLVRMLAAPGADESSIWPGSVIVLSVESRATVQIAVRATTGDFEARFELEHLDKTALQPASVRVGIDPGFGAVGRVESHAQNETRPLNKAEADRPALSMTGHVARRGDVAVVNGDWLAGPGDPAQIEGFAISGSSIDYQVLVAGQTRWTDWASDGDYAGTKGRYLPLIGVRLRIADPASSATLRAAALFLGSSPIEKGGRDIELRSHAGVDPMIGLMIDLKPSIMPSAIVNQVAASESKGRVRVFRSGQSSFN